MALCAADSGLSVTGFDTNEALISNLVAGRSHIDDVSDDDLQRGLRAGYTPSSDPTSIASADAVVVCVPTPLSADGGPDLRAVICAGKTIGKYLSRDTLVVLESTTYPGTTEEVFVPLLTPSGLEIGRDVHVAFSPERIDPGNQKWGVRNTPKVVGGVTQVCTQEAKEFYELFIDTVVPAKSAREAEMAKLLENTFRHVNIALVNEMLRFSNELDIDLWNAIDCAATKPFGFMPFRPGPGVGGHCIPVDPSYLSHRVKAELGYAFRMVELAEEINKAAPLYVAKRIWETLNASRIAVNGAHVLLIGVTYKANISDRRESPADALAKRLLSWGAQLNYHDPYVHTWQMPELALTSVSDLYAAAGEADIAVLLQNHDVYDLHRLSETCSSILDTRGVVPTNPHVYKL